MPINQDNRFVDKASLAVLSNPGHWQFVSSFHETKPEKTRRGHSFSRWMQQHHHAHPFYEVLMAVKGTALYGIGKNIFRCRPGTMVIISPNQPHTSKYLPADNHLYHIWISFITPEQAFAQFIMVERGRFRRLHDERCLISVDTPSRLLYLLKSLDTGNSPTKPAQVRLLLFAFFAELINRVIESGYHPADMIDQELLPQKKIALVCANLREPGGLNTTLASTASAAGYSPSHFARLFKRVTGHTFHEHIDAGRLERVKKLLTDNTPHKTIADMLGFASQSTFSRWLNKYRQSRLV